MRHGVEVAFVTDSRLLRILHLMSSLPADAVCYLIVSNSDSSCAVPRLVIYVATSISCFLYTTPDADRSLSKCFIAFTPANSHKATFSNPCCRPESECERSFVIVHSLKNKAPGTAKGPTCELGAPAASHTNVKPGAFEVRTQARSRSCR